MFRGIQFYNFILTLVLKNEKIFRDLDFSLGAAIKTDQDEPLPGSRGVILTTFDQKGTDMLSHRENRILNTLCGHIPWTVPLLSFRKRLLEIQKRNAALKT